jgi:uncharacterized protein (TIGR02284 family)
MEWSLHKNDWSRRKNHELETTLKSLVRVLDDSQISMAKMGERLETPLLRRCLLMESLCRANFRAELENILHRHGIADVHESGSASGKLYRAWAGLESALGAGDEAMLSTAEQAEDGIRDAYRASLTANLPLPVRQTLVEQQTHILIAGDFLSAQRHRLKAA